LIFVEHELVLSIHLGFYIENGIKNPEHLFCLQEDILDMVSKNQLVVQKYTQVLKAIRPRNSGTTNVQISTMDFFYWKNKYTVT
jgi:hypothetical protein